ncbi:MAG TPA: hypothetical protein VI461_02035, partial [Chitinophagaceae bacterium]|nr:hypothetical protein [Chitinophagaceae bacterium]
MFSYKMEETRRRSKANSTRKYPAISPIFQHLIRTNQKANLPTWQNEQLKRRSGMVCMIR